MFQAHSISKETENTKSKIATHPNTVNFLIYGRPAFA